jgi:hypothetical protein
MVQPFGNRLTISYRLIFYLRYDPVIALLNIYHRRRTYFHKKTNLQMLTAGLFTRAPN